MSDVGSPKQTSDSSLDHSAPEPVDQGRQTGSARDPLTQLRPFDYQTSLTDLDFLTNGNPSGADVIPMDVLIVGAGPAGLSAAIELARLCRAEPSLAATEIGVLEKAAAIGGHTLSGAVVNPIAFSELFPGRKLTDLPFKQKVLKEKVCLLTQSSHFQIPTPPLMKNHGNFVASICEIVRYLATEAESLGVNVLTNFPVRKLFLAQEQVVGLETVAQGLQRDGKPGPQSQPPAQLTGKITLVSEGTRSPLAQALVNKFKLNGSYAPAFALGVKELWRVKKAPDHILHTLGWPLPRDTFGGSWAYPLDEHTWSLGLVAGLDYQKTGLDVHRLLQKMKTHPLFASVLQGGEILEWGAKTIPEGGFNALPSKLHGNGFLLLGDAAGFVNVPALKGIHYAMMSGILAARAAFAALKANDFSATSLSGYTESVRSSWIYSDLKKVRNLRHAFKSGFYLGGIKAGLMTLTNGAFPGDLSHSEEDAKELKTVALNDDLAPAGGLSKVDAVYLSGNKTRDDIPTHLTVGKDIPAEVADMYVHLCPAGVYERDGERLVVNAPNCIDCKATDVLGPRWEPREGGSGPDYKQM